MNTKQQSLYEWAANTRINPTSDEYARYIESLHTCLTIIEAQPGYADALTISDALEHLDSNHDARDVFRWILTGDADGIPDELPPEVREYIRHGAVMNWNPIR